MVKIVINNDDRLYQCEECDFEYKEKVWAEKCEAWCKEHHTCNIEITKYALQSDDPSV